MILKTGGCLNFPGGEEKMKVKAKHFTAFYLSLLFAFSVWVLMDTFVIPRSFAAADGAEEAPRDAAPAEITATENGVMGPGVTVTMREERVHDTTIHIAEVQLEDAGCLRAALAQNTYGRNITQTVSEMAREHQAVLAVNGDYYGSRRSGYVIRNGVLYRDTAASAGQEDLCVWPDGGMTVIREGEITAQELEAAGVWQVFSFGPALVEGGAVAVDPSEEVGRAMASNPRTAIAMIEPLHYLFVVSDGRTADNAGLSLSQLAEFLRDQGAEVAYNLDGGGSSTLVFQDEVINWPTTNGRKTERAVSDIVYLGF